MILVSGYHFFANVISKLNFFWFQDNDTENEEDDGTQTIMEKGILPQGHPPIPLSELQPSPHPSSSNMSEMSECIRMDSG